MPRYTNVALVYADEPQSDESLRASVFVPTLSENVETLDAFLESPTDAAVAMRELAGRIPETATTPLHVLKCLLVDPELIFRLLAIGQSDESESRWIDA